MTANTGRQNQETLPRCRESLQTFQEWKDTMNTSINQARNSRPTIGKIVMALTLASVMGGISVSPALARDNDDRRDERARHERDHRHGHTYYYSQPVYREHPYYYSQPVYTPPPVYYAPQQSPGISLFLPLDIHHR
jgi:hypothetical protein